MKPALFGVEAWRNLCQKAARSCNVRAMTPMHFTFILGQQIDAALNLVHPAFEDSAIAIAREFGYETSSKRMEILDRIAHRPTGESAFQSRSVGAEKLVQTSRTSTTQKLAA